ncbi:MAG TPA: pirin-like C-terminal cupin domain-containing protein, partial [Chitinophagales bacterium]|nr:pirin-like C-terminal cupin domain-containing protein [Chitinophagales bacterium]
MKRSEFIKGSALIGLSACVPMLLRGSSGLFESTAGRRVYTILNADKTLVGTLPVLRVFAGNHDDYISPYVFFDEFGPVSVKAKDQPLRVNAHPHAGIIPTTYFLSGTGHHKDSLNYDFQIGRGDFMMFSSGRGAIHMEETGKQLYEEGGLYHGFQIWLNMPAKYKFIAPSTDVHRPDKMGLIEKKDFTARVVLGELLGVKSQIELLSPAFYFHLKMKAGCKLEIPVDATHNAFVYVVNGNVETEGRKEIKTNQVALYERGDNRIDLFTVNGAEILLAGGQPLNEPVYSYGPFVMNTEEEIQKCIRDYNSGKMGNPEMVNK